MNLFIFYCLVGTALIFNVVGKTVEASIFACTAVIVITRNKETE